MVKINRIVVLLAVALGMSLPLAAQQLRVDCAKRVYALPGRPFMQKFKVYPLQASVEAKGLPEGLRWNEERRLIEGSVASEGSYAYYVCSQWGDSARCDTISLLVSGSLPQPTPFMGLLTWNIFEKEISDARMRQLADAMADLGLAKAGYRYLCLDDCWAAPDRNADGRLMYDAAKFPEGLNALADYIHKRGLCFGVYSDAGSRTCSGHQPGSLGSEMQDAQSFAEWGFDLLKYDYCNNPGTEREDAVASYSAMGQALGKYAKPGFIYYLCEWGNRQPWLWGAEAGGTCWRSTPDTRDCWENPTYKGGLYDNILAMKDLWPYCGVNRFNDADMMMCGLHGSGKSSNAGTDGKGMTFRESQTQMILWCMWSSPLTLCFDITTLYDGRSRCGTGVRNPYYEDDLALITNPELIAIDQDPLGMAAEPVVFDSSQLVLMKDLADGGFAVSITNLQEGNQEMKIPLSILPAMQPGVRYRCVDLLSGDEDLGVEKSRDTFVADLPSHATLVWRFWKM